jgi:hypothetical protein
MVGGGKGRAQLFVAAADAYSRLCWALIRLDGKRPKAADWQNATPEPAELVAGKWSRWGERWNMGVVLGASGLVVVEPDTEEAQAVLLGLLGGELPSVPIVESGGKSLHLYFRDEGGQRNAAVDGLELRAGAQQVVLPPSVHPDTGRQYRWLDGHEPWRAKLTPIPANLLAYFAETSSKNRAAPVDDEIREPGRHRALLSIAGTMRHRGLGEAEILAALRATNELRCKPPLPDAEVVELAADVARRYEPAPPDTERERLEREADRLFAEAMNGASSDARRSERPRSLSPAPSIISLDEYLAGSNDEAEWIIDHLVAYRALSLFAGLPKVGKSTFVYGMLGAISSGVPFLGFDVNPSGVLLMTEEPPATVEEKADRFGLDPERVWVLPKRRIRSGRKWARIVADAVAFCREHADVRVIVVDTIDKFADLDAKRSESDTGVIRETIDPLYELLDLGCAVALITHQRKQEGDHGLRVRGGTSLTGSADVIAEVERAPASAALAKEARVVKLSSRFEGAPDEIAVMLDEDGWRSLGTIAGAKRRARREQVLERLTTEPSTLEEIHARAAGLVSTDTVRRRLGDLVADGLVDRLGEGVRGDPWRWRLSQVDAAYSSQPENGPATNPCEPSIHAGESVAARQDPRGQERCNESGDGVTSSPSEEHDE